MSGPENSPAYLTRCIEALLDALCEAHGLARKRKLDGRFAETLRFANDLISEGMTADPQTADVLEHVRDRVTAVSALFPSSETMH